MIATDFVNGFPLDFQKLKKHARLSKTLDYWWVTIHSENTGYTESNKQKLITEILDIFGESKSWKAIFKNHSIGTLLRGARYKESLTQQQVADLVQISRTRLSRLENNKEPLDARLAKKLAKVLRVSYKLFLEQ